jgi:hypothetical protein
MSGGETFSNWMRLEHSKAILKFYGNVLQNRKETSQSFTLCNETSNQASLCTSTHPSSVNPSSFTSEGSRLTNQIHMAEFRLLRVVMLIA